MKKAIHEAIKPVNLIPPHSHATADTTHNGQASGDVGHDMTQYKAREIGVLILCGAIAGGASLAVTLKHGDVIGTGDASYATITDGKATPANATLAIADTDDNKVYLARLRADALKKYLDVQIVQTGAFAAIYGVALLIGDSLLEAISQTAGVVFFKHETY